MTEFWDVHGWGFVIAMMFFPRLTLIFSSVVTGGFVWWLFWLFTPRILVAGLACHYYWDTNPWLVVGTWTWAVLGELGEKTIH